MKRDEANIGDHVIYKTNNMKFEAEATITGIGLKKIGIRIYAINNEYINPISKIVHPDNLNFKYKNK